MGQIPKGNIVEFLSDCVPSLLSHLHNYPFKLLQRVFPLVYLFTSLIIYLGLTDSRLLNLKNFYTSFLGLKISLLIQLNLLVYLYSEI